MKNNNKNLITLFIVILCCITTLISVGFSALNKNLSVSGDINYEYNSKLLYDVLRKEANIGTYAKEYTGDHRDSFTDEPTKSIYHWYASNDTNADTILDKWNVFFGGFCWQMIRTTDTGGIKLIYNGTPTDGTCNNTDIDTSIGTSKFNNNTESLSDAGYMYNTGYSNNKKSPGFVEVLPQKRMTGTSNYYGTGVTYSNGTYTLTGITQDTWSNIYNSSSGLYTCVSTTVTTCSTVYYIAKGTSSYIYGFKMTNGNLLNYYNTNLVFGTGYTESNGTYTLTNTTTIAKANWYDNASTYKNYYTCGDDYTTCTNLKYITIASNYYYYSISSSSKYTYAKNFTYDSGTNKYTLGSDRYEAWEMTNTDLTNLATHHYTCFDGTGECQNLSYVHRAHSGTIDYINLAGGKSIEDAVNEMLYDDNVNTTNSTIKTFIDNWYQNNMTAYTTYLEDIIFCNDRSQSNPIENGWNPNGGSVTEFMYFTSNSLTCTNDTDKFSVSNNKAKLTHPVGLATSKEMELLNNSNLKITGQNYWLSTANSFSNNAVSHIYINSSGSVSSALIINELGVRPVVSLKPGTEYTSGTGSKDDPYVVN